MSDTKAQAKGVLARLIPNLTSAHAPGRGDVGANPPLSTSAPGAAMCAYVRFVASGGGWVGGPDAKPPFCDAGRLRLAVRPHSLPPWPAERV
eukprot:6195254-Pleurochrysis_carterae.AAC.1